MTVESSLLGLGERLHEGCAGAGPGRFKWGSTARKYERSREFVVVHLALDLDLDFKEHSVRGSARVDFARRSKRGKVLSLDALGFVIESVELSTHSSAARRLSESEYSYDGDTLSVPIDDAVDHGHLTIAYRATPRLGLYFLEPDKEVPDRPLQVWSQCQDEDGKHWFPCQDKPHVKMTYELKVRVPSTMLAVSGGRLIEQKKLGNMAQFHYRLDEPTPAYLVTLVAGQFDSWEESVTLPSGRTIALRYLVPPGRVEDGKRAFGSTADAIVLFSERTGVEYPFESYTQLVVSDFIFGGMENTTATTMYEHILLDKHAALDMDSHDLVAHELAHHWFGDLVTCRDWSHAWLNEGFATYFEHIERERRLGNDEYEHHVTVDLNVYLGEAKSAYERPIVCRDYDEPIDLFDRHLYQKGGLVLHMLRRRLGDDAFFSAIHNYLNAHRGSIVETTNLVRALEETSGVSLERFFDEWVYRPGHPSLKVTIAFEGELLTVDVEQTQKEGEIAVFELPFAIDVGVEGAIQRHERLMHERKSSLVVRLSKRPSWVSVDPDYLITAPIFLNAPADLLFGLLKHGPKARGRRMAAIALGRRQDEKTVKALGESVADEAEAWMVRNKAAESLGKIGGQDAERLLIASLTTQELKVQRAVAEALGEFRTPSSEKALLSLTRSKSYLVSAGAARALGKMQSAQVAKVLRQLLNRPSWAEVIRASALSAISRDPSPEVMDLLLEWSRYGKPLRARRAALAALAEVGEGNKVRLHLEELLTDRDPHVRGAVVGALGALGDARSQAALSDLLERELDGGVKTKTQRVLADFAKESNAGVRDLKEENTKLKQEIQALGRRLSKLEQRSTAALKTEPPTPTPTTKKAKKQKKAAKKAAPQAKARVKKPSSRKG